MIASWWALVFCLLGLGVGLLAGFCLGAICAVKAMDQREGRRP